MNTTATVFGTSAGAGSGWPAGVPVSVEPNPNTQPSHRPAVVAETPPWTGPRWEHKVLSLGASRGGTPIGSERMLSIQGEQGWELVSVNVIGFDWHYHFKRPVRLLDVESTPIPINGKYAKRK